MPEKQNAETNLSAQKATPCASARFPLPFAHFGWSRGFAPPPVQGPASVVSVVDQLLRTTAVDRRSLMQRHHRLTGQARISEVHQDGQSAANRLLVIRAAPNGLDRTRFCFVASKRVGNAVVRNRVKRRLREVARLSHCEPGWDAIIIARQSASAAAYDEIEKAAHNLMRRTNLLPAESRA